MSLQKIFCYQNGTTIITPTRNPTADWVFSGEGKATELVDGWDVLVKIRNNAVTACDVLTPNGDYVAFSSAAYDDDAGTILTAADADAIDEAISNCGRIEDGTYEATAFGKGIAGNPLRMPYAALYYYKYAPIVVEDVPTGFDELGSYLQALKSQVANGVPREWGDAPAAQRGIIRASGVVWQHPDGRMAEIRLSDFTAYYAQENGKR